MEPKHNGIHLLSFLCYSNFKMILQAYGTTIAVAVLVGAWVGGRVWEALPWVLIFGLIGARAYHVLHFLEFYRANPIQTLFVWNGGLGIYGAILGGVVGLWVYVKTHADERGLRAGLARMLDIAAPGIAIAQAIGRFANFFSQELYGFPTDLPWGIYIKPENRFPGLENFEYFHPLFLYEALWCFLGFVVLLKVGRAGKAGGAGDGRKLLTGELFLLYISFYALGRFFLEGLRIESWMAGGVRVAQLLSAGIIFGSMGLAVFRRLGKRQLEIPNLK